MPRYKLTKPFDKSLTAYLLYYLASNCHRYLEVIKSFYPTQRGGELEYDKDEAIATTSKKLKYLFDLKNTFSIKDTPDGDLKKQKIQCKHNYKKLLHELSQIIIRRADPDIDRVDAVIANALKRSTEDITHRMSEKPTLPIYGPNDELELNIRYNILALKLIVHDFNKLNGKHVDSDEHKADMNEFSQLANYLMMHAEFVPAKSDSDKIIEPNNKQVEELTGILKEIRGETAKIGAILGIVETADRTLEKVYQKRETNGYAMLDNRISKISRCAYYIDMARSTISSFIRGREELNENIQVFTDAAKLKVFTSAGSRDYNWVTESFATNTSRLMEVAESGQAHLKPEQYAQVNEFISVTYSMSETKRRQEDSIDKIKNAGATIHLS